jgi:hypothetical protein
MRKRKESLLSSKPVMSAVVDCVGEYERVEKRTSSMERMQARVSSKLKRGSFLRFRFYIQVA